MITLAKTIAVILAAASLGTIVSSQAFAWDDCQHDSGYASYYDQPSYTPPPEHIAKPTDVLSGTHRVQLQQTVGGSNTGGIGQISTRASETIRETVARWIISRRRAGAIDHCNLRINLPYSFELWTLSPECATSEPLAVPCGSIHA